MLQFLILLIGHIFDISLHMLQTLFEYHEWTFSGSIFQGTSMLHLHF